MNKENIQMETTNELGKWIIAVTGAIGASNPEAFKGIDMLKVINLAELLRKSEPFKEECSE